MFLRKSVIRMMGQVSRNKGCRPALELSRSMQLTKRPIRYFSNPEDAPNQKESFNIKKEFKKFRHRIQHEFNKNKESYTIMAALFGLGALYYFYGDYLKPTLSYSQLEDEIRAGTISKISIVHITDETKTLYSYALVTRNASKYRVDIMDTRSLISFLGDIKAKSGVNVNFEEVFRLAPLDVVSKSLSFLFYIIIISSAVSSLMKGRSMSLNNSISSGVTDFSKSMAKKFSKETNLKIRFADVAGMDEAKLEIEEFVDFIKHPEKYKELGAKLPKGALLAGPPGTGKTLLAKACAGEAGVPFFFVSGSEFVEMFVGVGASRVRDLFKQAKESSPAIIFIDEIDAVGKKRSAKLSTNSEADSTLNQLLVEMDGFGTDSNVVVFAATNRKELLDSALTRPGRFDRSIDVTLPDIDGRRDIFKVHLKPLKLENDGKFEKHAKRLASLTPGFSGADIANICNEAAIQAVRKQHTFVEDQDFEVAVERVIGGLEKKRNVNIEERRVVAVHESGHGVIGWFLEGASPLLKLTIIPRSKGALGFAQYLPNEQSLETYQELEDKIVAVLGGRCAELEFFGRVTTGAYDDLQKAYKIAHSMVTKLGMSDKIGYLSLEENEFGVKTYSDETNREIDQECKRIIDKCTQRCIELIKLHKNKIENLSNILLEKETIDLKVITEVLGPRPFAPRPSFKAYLEESVIS